MRCDSLELNIYVLFGSGEDNKAERVEVEKSRVEEVIGSTLWRNGSTAIDLSTQRITCLEEVRSGRWRRRVVDDAAISYAVWVEG